MKEEELSKTSLNKNDNIFTLFMDLGYRTLCDGVERSLCNTVFLACKEEDTIPQAINRTLEMQSNEGNNLILNNLKEEIKTQLEKLNFKALLENNSSMQENINKTLSYNLLGIYIG
jgi:hypothetical protein